MCAIFGFMNYKGIVTNTMLKKLIKALAISAEVRGTDATGIGYVNGGKMVTFKQAKPAHKVKLYFPADTKCVIGHTRFTTQGSEKLNYNNHPFDSLKGFSLAHNGVLYNDKELRKKYMLHVPKVETDSYIAVQMLEYFGCADMENIKLMSEIVEGSFVFTILRNDNTLFLVKGSNPIAVYHFEQLGIYIYASTKEILENALNTIGFRFLHTEIRLKEGDILQINPDGTTDKGSFEVAENFRNYHYLNYPCGDEWYEDDSEKELIFEYCGMFGVSEEDVELLLDFGYTAEEIEYLLMDTSAFEEAVNEAKGIERW